jgi:cupin 2 domain-containing protein
MRGPIANLLDGLPPPGPDEVFEPLFERAGVRLERIVSFGQSTPPDAWYDQAQDEWVMVVAGAARLRIEGQGVFDMNPGDTVFLPAHCRHRVEWTDPRQPTVWLALHVWSEAHAPGSAAAGQGAAEGGNPGD